ncbi:TPA_asm: hypothetical protein GJG76_23055 [Salmonella enterica subsp. enterica serovar Enteritidis]|uniref:DUF8038 domain-containing protein n=1 Tax=Salmonella enteritidis TaxID=149539 RepID=A0A6Y0UJM2_SALEN|nr:hypothetical protein [Salmonella enterica subsp. enterica serovar Enteritidis]
MINVLSKITGGLIPAYRLGAQVSDGPVSSSKFKENLDGRLEKLRNRGEQPIICYEVAIHAARAGNAITKEAEKTLKAEKNYSINYLALMNISASTSRGYFDSREIKESGFLNFEQQGNGIQHTAYLHKDSNGTLILAHNNSLSLDKELSPTNGQPECRGGANVYNITSGYDADINRYMTNNNYSFHYTPASKINEKF